MKFLFTVLPLLVLILFSCNRKKIKTPSTNAGNPDTVESVPLQEFDTDSLSAKEPSGEQVQIRYHLAVKKAGFDFKSTYNEQQLNIIGILNRIDVDRLNRLDTVILPDTFTDVMDYSPFPKRIPLFDSLPKLLLFSYPIQAFAAYEKGALVRWGPVSLGKKSSPTPTGLMYTNWKSKERYSTVNEEWLLKWYFNIDCGEGVSIHAYELPGYPASHACIRLREEDAFWVYHWAGQWKLSQDEKRILSRGTPVIVYARYNFGAGKPWLQLSADPSANQISADSLAHIILPYIPATGKSVP